MMRNVSLAEQLDDFDAANQEYKLMKQVDKEARNATLEEAATIALEQRCERSTPWDMACVAIAQAIRGKIQQ